MYFVIRTWIAKKGGVNADVRITEGPKVHIILAGVSQIFFHPGCHVINNIVVPVVSFM